MDYVTKVFTNNSKTTKFIFLTNKISIKEIQWVYKGHTTIKVTFKGSCS